MDSQFHARFMVDKKTYKYYLNMGEYNPLQRNSVYQYNKELDVDKMKQAIKDFIGTYNFKVFASREVIKESYVRSIYNASIEVENDILIFTFIGNGFMKYQVRNMVGTLIKIGKGKIDVDSIKKLLNKELDEKIVSTARPEGLYLMEVSYK